MGKYRADRSVIVIGGGAGGLMAALSAAGLGGPVTLLEKANRVGKKLLKTGNGRCNLSNTHVSPAGYNHPDFVAPLLADNGCASLLDFFATLGLWTVTDDQGRAYPWSDTASSVLDVLRLGAAARGVKERCGIEVTAILPEKKGFTVRTRKGDDLSASQVIVATGGGTGLLRPLGHRYVPFAPVLCPLKTDADPIRGISGLRVKCRATLFRRGREVFADRGEVLFRDFGVSGILALDLSRYALPGDVLSLDLTPELSREELEARLAARKTLALPAAEALTGILHRRVGEAVRRAAGSPTAADLSAAMKDFRLTVRGPGDVQNAQVTRGGAEVSQFDPLTMESLLIPGIYAVGEALDVDGRCGGYNLHWAFVSGRAAGRSAAE